MPLKRFVLIAAGLLWLAGLAHAQEATSPTAAAEATAVTTATLSFNEGSIVEIVYIPVISQMFGSASREITFTKEPAYGSDKVYRNAFDLSGSGRKTVLGFAIDEAGEALYLDRNGNLDLTDDGDPIRANVNNSGKTLGFDSVTIRVGEPGQERQYALRIRLYNSQHCSATLVSYWAGEVTLAGRPWRIAVADNLNGTIDSCDQLYLIPAQDEGADAHINWIGRNRELPVSPELVLDGRLYGVSYAFEAGEDGNARIVARFEDKPTSTVDVTIAGERVEQAVLIAGSQTVAVLQRPGAAAALPPNAYQLKRVWLRGDNGDQFHTSGNVTDNGKPIIFDCAGPQRIALGAPLKNSVEVSKKGRNLDMKYILVGQGGETYQPARVNYSKKPEFAIYKGDRKIASGNFEYG